MNQFVEQLVPVLPCSNVITTRAFYARLGFRQVGGDEVYAMLETGSGSRLHLRAAAQERIDPRHNVGGVYLFSGDVDGLAAKFPGEILESSGRPEVKPWGTYEFALSDPDGALVRVGWPTAPKAVPEKVS